MEARFLRAALFTAIVCSLGASHRTRNFIVTARTPQLARQVAESAESMRRELAVEWLGQALPAWRDPCPIRVDDGPHLGAGGATSFMFEQGRPFGWTMSIQGSQERILDSVLPHEVTHTIFATHFGRPLPRWADEGACTTVEHTSERHKQQRLLIQFLQTDRGIAFNNMFAMKQYPRDILPLYAQGYSLARFLIAQGGKRKFIKYVGDGMSLNNWPVATAKHYGYKDLSVLQVTWLDWVRRGSPAIQPNTMLASTTAPPERAAQSAAAAKSEPSKSSSPYRLASTGQRRSSDSGTPASTASASSTSQPPTGSWYARHRDRTHKDVGTKADVSSTAKSTDTVSGSQPVGQPVQSVTRPQPVGRPRQVILEWSKGTATAPPASVPTVRR